MATLRNKRKLAAVSRDTQKEHPSDSQSRTRPFLELLRNTSRKFLEEIEGKVSKKLSQDFSRKESRILRALSKLDEFLSNPLVRTLSRTVAGTSRNIGVQNQEPTGDLSQIDPHPEMEFSACWSSNSIDSDPKEASHNNT